MKSQLLLLPITLLSLSLSSCSKGVILPSGYGDYYDSKVRQFMEDNKTIGDVDVCYLGDSLTDLYDVNKWFPEYKNANRGIGGDTTDGLAYRIKPSAYEIKPKVITFWIGFNNLETMFNNYESILKGLHKNLPDSKIAIIGFTPNTWGRQEQVLSANPKVKKIAEKYSHPYVDLYDYLLDNSTGTINAEYTIDGGHFTEKGYEIITSILKPVIDDLMKG